MNCTDYLNLTPAPVQLKTRTGQILKIEPGKGAEAKKEDPFTKIKYFIGGWRNI